MMCPAVIKLPLLIILLHISTNCFRFQKPKILAALKAMETDINTMAAFFG